MNPHAPGVSAPTPTPVPVPVPVSTTVAPMSSMPSPTRVSIESSRRQDSVNISSSGPDVSSDLAASVSTISAASQRALKTADGLVAASASSNTTLTQLIQKLAAEKISILAAIDAAEVDAQEKKKQLAFTIEEIRSLEGQLSDLRTQLDQKRATGHVSQGQLGEAVLQKQSLMNQITQARGEIAQLSNDISSVSMDVGKSEGLRAEVQDKSAALDKDKSSLAQEVGSLNGELAFLQSILASLQGDKDGRANELVRVQGQRSVSQQALQRERGTVDMREKEVEVLRDQKKALTSQKQETLDAIAVKAASGTATVSSAAPVSAPVEAATPTPAPVVAPTKVIQVPDAVPTSVVADDFAASPAFDDFLPSTPAVTAPVHTISMPVDDFAPSTADSFEPSIMSPTAHEEPAFGDFSDFPEPTKVSFEEGTKEDVFPRPSNAPSRNVSSDTPGKSLVRMSSESSVLSVDPFDPFRPSKQRPGLSTSLQSNKSYIPKDVVVTHVEDDGDDFDGDFDKNPFESPFGSSSDSKALQAAAAANNGTKHESEAVDSGFSDDAFAPSSADDFAPSPAGSKLPPDQENTGNTGDFGFSGFDKNPFEDMPADVFGSSSTSFDAFGASPFDSFGDAPAATAGEKKTESGFDEW